MDAVRSFCTPVGETRRMQTRPLRAASRSRFLDGDGALLVLGSVCSTLFVAAVATAFVSVGWAAVVVLGWLALVAVGCLVVCAGRLVGRR